MSPAPQRLDAEGRLTDKDLRERLRVYMEQFAAFVASARAAIKPAQG